jgi:hypothetical protein
MSSVPTRFRFRPRFRAVALLALVLGVGLGLYGLVAGGAASTFLVVLGMGGAALGGLYLGSPAWRMTVVVGDDGLEAILAQLAEVHGKALLGWSVTTASRCCRAAIAASACAGTRSRA